MTHFRPYLLPLLALLLTTGCHKKNSNINPASLGPTGSDTNGPAPTATITADPAAIDQGRSTVLNWRTTNATSVTIDGIGQVNPNGTQTATPASSTNFHLTAKGDGGTTEANVRVTVRASETLPTGGGTILARDQNQSLGGSVTDQAFNAAVQDIFFDYDAIDLRPDAKDAADTAAAFLRSHPTIRVLIGGYCDERGSAEYNLALGENRANAAKAALIGAGVSPSRIRVISYGKEKQFCTEAAESCYQENRRAQFTIDR